MTIEDYNRCVEDHADGLYRFILKNVRDPEKADDIVQDSFEKLWRKRADVSVGKSKSYLFSTAYHTMIDGIRRDRRMGDFSNVKEESYSHEHHYTDLQEVLHIALERLPDVQKMVILLRDYEGYSYAEIGGITGLSESQVKVYIYRGRLSLKEYIGSLQAVI